MISVLCMEALGKGKYKIKFDTGICCVFYRGEISNLQITDGGMISEDVYHHLLNEVVGKRAKKRAMYLLEQMDRTEHQLREKLMRNEYPLCCIDDAIEYVKKFHYLDDVRYAENYVRYFQEKLSRQQITVKLLQKGVAREIIANAIENEYQSDEYDQIKAILMKKRFENTSSDSKEFQRMYQYLLRRGFKSSDILKAMKYESDTTYC